MCILCGDYVNLFGCIFYSNGRYLNLVSMFFIGGMCVVALALEASNMSGATFHPLAVDIHRFSYQGFPWQICHYNM